MKKQTVLLAAALFVVGAAAALATPIAGGKHDLSAGSNFAGADEICIYCHTPHNPVVAIPLWNRNNPSGSLFSLYKTSPTLTTATKASSLSQTSVSLFCMSCHDGITSLGNIKSTASHTMTVKKVSGVANLTQDLTNSHPIGFDYKLAQEADPGLIAIGTAANNLGVLTGGSYPFFASDLNTGTMMECASCHKVHDNAEGYFLRKTNTGSALCLACHNK